MITDRDPEFIATITALYQQELGRDPDPGGLQTYLSLARAGWTGDQIRQSLHDSPEGIAYRSRPAPLPLPNLADAGNFWADRINGTDQFAALRLFLDGKDVLPLIRESNELRFNCWRIFAQGSIAQNGIMDLRPQQIGDSYYTSIAALSGFLNAHGIVPLWTVFVDNQDVRLGVDHWQRFASAVAPYTVLVSGGNEFSKNGFDPQALTAPALPWWSRGSDVGDMPPPHANGATFSEFHPRRDLPKSLDDAVASATFLRSRGYTKLVVDEPPRMGTDGSGPEYADPRQCWEFARIYATEWAGAVFHSRAGQASRLMDDTTRACAQQWGRGFVDVP
jgi:hypothetical protein